MGAKNLAKLPTHAEVRAVLEAGLNEMREMDCRKLPLDELKVYCEVIGQMVRERHGSSPDLRKITEYMLLIRVNG